MPRKTKQNSITTPEILKSLNRGNMRLKLDFLNYLKSVKRSQGTIDGYSNDLDIFFTWNYLFNNDKDFIKISKRDMVTYQGWLLDENGNSPARVRRLKAAISSLSNFVENILDDEPEFEGFKSIVRKIENPALQAVREKTVYTDEELEGLLKALVDKKDYEKACYVALAMYSGRRKAELCRFKMSDFDDDRIVCDNSLYKSVPIQTKGNKFLECYTLKKKFDPYLELWKTYRRENNIESEWLFFDKSDPTKQMNATIVNSWSKTFSRITKKDFYIHSLRHYYVSALVRAGIPDSVVIDIIGWSSAEMLKIYNDNPKDEQIGMYFKGGEVSAPEAKDFSDI